MGLLTKLSVIETAADASSITVLDSTGAYNAGTNPGGYGAPNPTAASVLYALIQLAHYDDLTSYGVKQVDPEDIIPSLGATGFVLTPSMFSAITPGSVFKDGVYDMKYNVMFNTPDNITVTPGSSRFTMPNASTVFADCVGFALSDEPDVLYYLDRTKTLDNTGGYIVGTFAADITPIQAGRAAYETFLKILITRTGNDCLNTDIALWSDQGCKNEKFRDVWTRYTMKIAMEGKFSQQLYMDAHRLAMKLESYCNSSNNCQC